MEQTLQQYDAVMGQCRALFEQKTRDYGTAWRIMRLRSLTDQMFIKARRIRSLEEKGHSAVGEGVEGEFVGLINYGAMAIVQEQLDGSAPLELGLETALDYYDAALADARQLMLAKNHDYGEVWREMRVSSMTDLILMKLLRIKQIEDNAGLTLVSEGVAANYRDIINYAAFALIQLGEAAARQ